MYSVLAGFMIAMGGYINLTLGGIPGALFFAIGLLTILHFKFNLFTGKAGALALGKITWEEIICIWCGNFLGTAIGATMTLGTPKGMDLTYAAVAIIEQKVSNHPVENLVLGIGCGVLMFIAVKGYQDSHNITFVFVPVATFILADFNHCVADMYYLCLGAMKITDFGILIPTTIGNILGCNMINWCLRYEAPPTIQSIPPELRDSAGPRHHL